jgi:Ca2+-binding RTX toxin-like protein
MSSSQRWDGDSWQTDNVLGRSIYRKDLTTGELVRLVGTEKMWSDLDVSHDGRFVSFKTYANHDPLDEGNEDLYRLDTQTGELDAISTRSDGRFSDDIGSYGFQDHEMSADGRFVAFTLRGGNLHSSSGVANRSNVFLKDMLTGELLQISQTIYGQAGAVGVGVGVENNNVRISVDGSVISFLSNAENLQSTETEWSTQYDSVDVVQFNVQDFKNALASHHENGVVLALGINPASYDADTEIDVTVTWGDGGPQDIVKFDARDGGIELGHRFDLAEGEHVTGSATLALDGEAAFGQVSFTARKVSYDESLPEETRTANLSGGDEMDFLFGGAYADQLSGGANHDVLRGNDGADTLSGDAGDDLIIGGAGADQLTGGSGKDRFVFSSLDEGGDVIADFEVANDTIVLSGELAASLPQGWVDGFNLIISENPQALLPSASLTYDSNSGILSYDADGGGDNDPVVLATLLGSPVLTLDHFEISNDF